MSTTDLIGATGVALLLIAFLLSLFFKLSKEGFPYLLLNILGAGLACFASVLLQYWPFIILEGIWTLVSLVALFRLLPALKKQ